MPLSRPGDCHRDGRETLNPFGGADHPVPPARRSQRVPGPVWTPLGSLREISRDDVTLGGALRSTFKVLKGRKLVFTNPVAGIRVPAIERRQSLPAAPADTQQRLHSDDPAQAVLAALIAYHGLRPAELRALQLTDIRDGRIWLPDRTIPLADPARTRVTTWLDERNRRWPSTTAAGRAPPPPICSSTRAPPSAQARSATPGSGGASASPQPSCETTGSSTTLTPPTATSAASPTSSVSPSRRRFATPPPSTTLGSRPTRRDPIISLQP